MMETKLWIALCALPLLLLLINSGSADHANDHTTAPVRTPGAAAAAKAPATDSLPASGLEPTIHPALNGSDKNPISSGNSSVSGNTTKNGETTSLPPEPKADNDTNSISPPVTPVPENNGTLTKDSTSQPQILPSESNTTTTITTASPTNTTHSVVTAATNTSNFPASPTSGSTSPPEQPTQAQYHSSTSALTPETETSTTTTTTSTQSSSTSSTHSSQEPPTSQKSTVAPSSSTSTQTKAHAETPSQLNVGGDTKVVHESPTLDPLLAGLVSAFIITAVIITLLLFLKLRRRDNRPEFRRLQDLPMDDMMEDTPLSMYSY
ncbi:putative protein TPRXL isoform X1 [Lates japonicus]